MTVRISAISRWPGILPFGLTAALTTGFAHAANPASPVATAPLPSSAGLFQIIFALALVVALMLVMAWAFRKLGPIRTGNRVPMKVISGLQLGTRERVMVVEVDQQWLIIGVTAHNISHLGSLPKQDDASADQTVAANGNVFQDWLKKTLDKQQSSNASPL